MKLLDLIDPKSIVPNLESSDRNGAIKELTAVLAIAGLIGESDVDRIVKSILQRERSRGTTGFGKGVALPHAKIEGLDRVIASVGRSVNGLEYDSHDGQPVFGIILVLSPVDQAEAHLNAMQMMYKHLLHEKFRKFLRQSDSTEKIYDLLKEADDRLLA